MRLIVAVLLSVLVGAVNAAPMNTWPKKIILLTTESVSLPTIESARNAAKGAQFDYFYVDQSQNILKHIESTFPQSLLDNPEAERNAYIEKHMAPQLKALTPELMRSKMGIGLIKLYQIKRIPAVIIDDKYITYGLSVPDSITLFVKTRSGK